MGRLGAEMAELAGVVGRSSSTPISGLLTSFVSPIRTRETKVTV